MRKYKVNEQFFEVWSNDMAYVLGVIASDGCLFIDKEKRKSIRIGININDIDWLKSIRSLIGSNHQIYERQEDNIALLCIGSKKMFDDIIQIGIHPKKSLNLKFPQMPEKHKSHFVRGYFDGDGYVGKLNDGKGNIYLRCSISGTKEFLSELKQVFSKIYEKEIGSIRFAHRCYELTYGGNKSIRDFFTWVYMNSNPNTRLERKYTQLQRLCSNNVIEVSVSPPTFENVGIRNATIL